MDNAAPSVLQMLGRFLGLWVCMQGIVGCDSGSEKPTGFTLESGVTLLEAKDCDTGQKPALPASSVRKISDGYQITVSAFFACNADLSKPYLIGDSQRKATLVLQSSARKEAFNSSCECPRSLVIKLSQRLEPNDTLYLLREHEVLGHLVMP